MTERREVLAISDVTVTFCRWGQNVIALNRVSLTISSGEWVMLVGHNGSGKSTLLKAISGRVTGVVGSIKIAGKPANEMRSAELAERVFHVHQDPLMGTAPTLTLFENLMVADQEAQSMGTPRSALGRKYRELLRPLGLADRMKQLAQYFSGGERQLVALLIARLRQANLLLLDEPLAALDPAKADMCLAMIKELHEQGTTIIEVTHDPTLAVSGGTRTIALREGRFVYDQLGVNRTLTALQEAWSARLDVGPQSELPGAWREQGTPR